MPFFLIQINYAMNNLWDHEILVIINYKKWEEILHNSRSQKRVKSFEMSNIFFVIDEGINSRRVLA